MSQHPISAGRAEPVDPAVARFLAPVGGHPDDDNWPSASPPSASLPPDGSPVGTDSAPPGGHALTPRQEAFADAYADTPNGAAAARAAGYATGHAKVAAARNLRRSGVLKRIMERRREQALAREAARARIAGILEEALDLARERRNAHAMARIAGLMMRLGGLQATTPADDRMLADATEDQLDELLACYEIAAGVADPELPDPDAASVEELADRAAELMRAARSKARIDAGALPGVRVADRYLSGLIDYLEQGVRDATDACAFARMVDEAAGDPGPAADRAAPEDNQG